MFMYAYSIKSLPLVFDVGLIRNRYSESVFFQTFVFAKFNFFNYSEEYEKNKA